MTVKNLHLVVGFISCLATGANAATGNAFGDTFRVLQGEDDQFGGCMVEVDPVPAGLDCPGAGTKGWLTLDCVGAYGSKSSASNRLNAATLALITKSTVQYFVDDSRKHNGFCMAFQFRNLR